MSSRVWRPTTESRGMSQTRRDVRRGSRASSSRAPLMVPTCTRASRACTAPARAAYAVTACLRLPWPMSTTSSSARRSSGRWASTACAAARMSSSQASRGVPMLTCRPSRRPASSASARTSVCSLPGMICRGCTATWVKFSRHRRRRALSTESFFCRARVRRVRSSSEERAQRTQMPGKRSRTQASNWRSEPRPWGLLVP